MTSDSDSQALHGRTPFRRASQIFIVCMLMKLKTVYMGSMRILARINRAVTGVVSGGVRCLEEKGDYTLLIAWSSVQNCLATPTAFRRPCAKGLYFFPVAFVKVMTINGPLKPHNDTSIPPTNPGDCHSRRRFLPAEISEISEKTVPS